MKDVVETRMSVIVVTKAPNLGLGPPGLGSLVSPREPARTGARPVLKARQLTNTRYQTWN